MGGSIPDLRYLSREGHQQWDSVVLGGVRSKAGMIAYDETLSSEDSAAVHAFVIAQARKAYAAARELEKKK